MMEKRNVVEDKRTPEHEISRPDENWDKKAADQFKPVVVPVKPNTQFPVINILPAQK
jgi:hypothetical protein